MTKKMSGPGSASGAVGILAVHGGEEVKVQKHAILNLLLDRGSTPCYLYDMAEPKAKTERFFKTAWFAKTAKKADIKDEDLCKAIQQVLKGQADDLGGGVFKKRLNKNLHRSIVLAKGRKYWVYAYLFAKKDRENIEDDELKAFRKLADLYETKTDKEIQKELDSKELLEICQ